MSNRQYEDISTTMFQSCEGTVRDALLTPGEIVLQVFQRDTTTEVAAVIAAARILTRASLRSCSFCGAGNGHAGDCPLFHLAVSLWALDEKVRVLGGTGAG